MKVKPAGLLSFANYKNKNYKVYAEVAKLKVGEALVVKRKEWVGKEKSIAHIYSMTFASKRKDYKDSPLGKMFIGKKFSIRTLADRSGWGIVRLL